MTFLQLFTSWYFIPAQATVCRLDPILLKAAGYDGRFSPHAKGLCYTVYIKVGCKHTWGAEGTALCFGLILYRRECGVCVTTSALLTEWWLTTYASEETGKWVMLTLFAAFNWCFSVASQSMHSSCVFPRRLLMLDESTAVVDQRKQRWAEVSTVYHCLQHLSSGILCKHQNNVAVGLKYWTFRAMDSVDRLEVFEQQLTIQFHIVLIRKCHRQHD